MAEHKIDNTPGRELGLSGRFEDTPAFEIVNAAHDQFLALMSRLISVEYGPLGAVAKNDPRWLQVTARKTDTLDRLHQMGGDAVEAAKLFDQIQDLDAEVDAVLASASTAGAADAD